MKRAICTVVVALFVMVSVLHGEGFYLGGYGAYSFGGDIQNESLGYGVSLGLSLGENWNLEFSGTLLEDDSPAADAEDFDLGSIDVSLLYHLPVSSEVFDIYMGVGASYNRFNFNSHIDREIKDDDQVGFLGVVGVALSPVDWLRIFADIRYNVMTYEVVATDLDRVDEDYNFFMVRVGAGFAL